MNTMSISLFVAEEHYQLFRRENFDRELEKNTGTKMNWADEDQGCRQLTLEGSVFSIHASHLAIVKMICDEADDAMQD